MHGVYSEPSAEGQPRKKSHKSVALRRADATKQSPPLPPPANNLFFRLDPGETVVGMVPAPPGTRVMKLDRDERILGEHNVIGFVTIRSPLIHGEGAAELLVQPVTVRGVVGGKFIIAEPEA